MREKLMRGIFEGIMGMSFEQGFMEGVKACLDVVVDLKTKKKPKGEESAELLRKIQQQKLEEFIGQMKDKFPVPDDKTIN